MTRYLHVSVLKLSSGFRAVGILRGPTIVPLGEMFETREQAAVVAEATPRKNPVIAFKDMTAGAPE